MTPSTSGSETGRRNTRLDVLLAAALFAMSTAIAARTFERFRLADVVDAPELNDHVFGAALMQVCGRPGVFPTFSPDEKTHEPTKAAYDFIQGRRQAIRCDELPGSLTLSEWEPLLRASRYLIQLVAFAWVLATPSWHSIAGLVGLLFGVTVTAMYVSCRLTMGAIASAIVAGLIALSPLQLWNVANLRDFSKAPFFALTLVACGLLVTQRIRRATLFAIAAAIGLVLGFGVGVRTDVALDLVAVVVTIGVFFPSDRTDRWRTKVLALGICLGAFLLAARPILKVSAGGGNLWHWALLGLAHDFDEPLGVGETPYRFGYFYDDSYVAWTLNAFNWRVNRAPAPLYLNSPSYERAGRDYFLRIVRTFPADLAARAWASLVGILNLPFSSARLGPVDLPPPVGGRLLRKVFHWRAEILRRLDRRGWILFAAVLCGLAVVNLRLATFVLFLVCFFGMYPAIQYDPRHFFPLECLSLWSAAFLGSSAIKVLRDMRAGSMGQLWRPAVAGRVVSFALGVAVIVVLPLAVMRSYQRGAVTLLLSSYEHAQREPVPFDIEASSSETVRLTPTWRREPAEETIRSEMIVTSVVPGCPVNYLTLAFRYLTRNPAVDFSRTVTVPVSGVSAKEVMVFMPVFETGVASGTPDLLTFAGIDISTPSLPCIGSVSRFHDPSAFPLLLEAVLPVGWQALPLYQTVRAVEARARVM